MILSNVASRAGVSRQLASAWTTLRKDLEEIMEKMTSTAIADLTFVAFDVETTGLSPVAQRLVEISGVKFGPGSGEEPAIFSRLINPECPIPREVQRIHGITDEMVREEPTFREVIPEFIEFVGDCILMAHNAPFDVEFVRVSLARLGMPFPKNKVVDTLVMSRELLPDAPRHQLKTVVELLGLPAGDYHRALADSVHVRDVFLKLTTASGLSDFEALEIMGAVSTFDFDRHAESVRASMPEQSVAIMDSISRAIELRQVVKMTYNGTYRSNRTILPLSLIHSRGQFYLNAICQSLQAERTFRVDRIDKVVVNSG
ncbi:MAG: WYL domain-containing protein [Candidatus Melainabacteria bacterium]|nr:WYL domain-containing protein [Candidatus Melainabacteria bacterium]